MAVPERLPAESVEHHIEITLNDGGVCIWIVRDEETIDRVTDAIEAILGLPDTQHL